MARNAIIGAGPMGLVCALELLKRGESVDIFENDDRIGGMSASFDFDGLPIERFYHFIVKTDQPLFTLLDELGIADKLRWTDTRMGFYCDGRLYPWGTRRRCCVSTSWAGSTRCATRCTSCIRRTSGTGRNSTASAQALAEAMARRARISGAVAAPVRPQVLRIQRSVVGRMARPRIKRVALSRRGLTQESLGFIDGGSQTLLSLRSD
jgi:protoporphyrinogen oxidase